MEKSYLRAMFEIITSKIRDAEARVLADICLEISGVYLTVKVTRSVHVECLLFFWKKKKRKRKKKKPLHLRFKILNLKKIIQIACLQIFLISWTC